MTVMELMAALAGCDDMDAEVVLPSDDSNYSEVSAAEQITAFKTVVDLHYEDHGDEAKENEEDERVNVFVIRSAW